MWSRHPSTDSTARAARADGFAMVIALILLLLLVILGTSLLSLSALESNISHNDYWAEGALHAAEASVHAAIDALRPDPVSSTQPIPLTSISDDYDYRSGGRLAADAEPLVYLGQYKEPGYSINVGTGYNPSGYSFARYRINATGSGPRQIRREIEVMAHYGPIPE